MFVHIVRFKRGPIERVTTSPAPAVALLLLRAVAPSAAPWGAQAPPVRVYVAESTRAGSTTYSYRVVNGSQQALVTLVIGYDRRSDTPQLRTVPLGWTLDQGLPASSTTAPPGWVARAVTMEESDLINLEWSSEGGSAGDIPPGATATGFSVKLPRPAAEYRNARFEVLLANGARVTGSLEAGERPAGRGDTTRVVLLGTGMPRPNPNASGPATAVVLGDRVFLVDAGAGVERQLAAGHLPINGVTALFVTHLHSDHTLGYPDLILTSWVMGRRASLEAYGPHGLQRMTQGILDAWSEDIAIRINGLEHESPTGYQVHVHEIDPGVVYDSAGVRVTAIRVQHGSWPEALGYRFDTPERSITISGDTRPSEDLVREAAGTDVFIHEVYPASRVAPERRPGGENWPQYMREFHTSDVELGALAARIQPKLLILYHMVGGSADEEILAGIRRGGFTGRVVIGKDLDRY